MNFNDDPPGALVKCKYCGEVFGAPVYHNCPEAPDVDPEVAAQIDADPQPADDTVIGFENGNKYHEPDEENPSEAVCPATDGCSDIELTREEAQEKGLVLCQVCADRLDIDYKVVEEDITVQE